MNQISEPTAMAQPMRMETASRNRSVRTLRRIVNHSICLFAGTAPPRPDASYGWVKSTVFSRSGVTLIAATAASAFPPDTAASISGTVWYSRNVV